MSKNTLRFRGKIAWWWYALTVLIILCTVWLATQGVLSLFASSATAGILIVCALFFLLFVIFMFDSCIRNSVIFFDSHLQVRLSVFSVIIPYSEIESIRETHNALASLSTSLDRLAIQYKNYNDIMISVKDKEAFLAEILKRNPHIHVKRKSNTKK